MIDRPAPPRCRGLPPGRAQSGLRYSVAAARSRSRRLPGPRRRAGRWHSQAVGTGAQFVEIPKVGKDRVVAVGRDPDRRRGRGPAAGPDVRAGQRHRTPARSTTANRIARRASRPRRRCYVTARRSTVPAGANRRRGRGSRRGGTRPVPRPADAGAIKSQGRARCSSASSPRARRAAGASRPARQWGDFEVR